MVSKRDVTDNDYNIFVECIPKEKKENKLSPLDNSKVYVNGEINPLAEFMIINKESYDAFNETRKNTVYYMNEKYILLKFLHDRIIMTINNKIKIILFYNEQLKCEDELIIIFINGNVNKIISELENPNKTFKYWLKNLDEYDYNSMDEKELYRDNCHFKLINKRLKNKSFNSIIKPSVLNDDSDTKTNKKNNENNNYFQNPQFNNNFNNENNKFSHNFQNNVINQFNNGNQSNIFMNNIPMNNMNNIQMNNMQFNNNMNNLQINNMNNLYIKEIDELKKKLNKANKIIENQNKEIQDLKNQLSKINVFHIDNNQKGNLINELNNKNIEINLLKQQLQNFKNNNGKNIKNKDKCVTFITQDYSLCYGVPCSGDSIFAEIEEQLYQEYPEYRETNNTFLAQGKIILRFKTIDQNNIGTGKPVILVRES